MELVGTITRRLAMLQWTSRKKAWNKEGSRALTSKSLPTTQATVRGTANALIIAMTGGTNRVAK